MTDRRWQSHFLRKNGGSYLLCPQLDARVDTAALVRRLAGATPMSTLQ